MTIVGFSFTNIKAEKNDIKEGKVNISNNVAVKDIKKAGKSDVIAKNQDTLKFDFEFNSKFDPKIGIIKVQGELTYMGEKGLVKEVIDKWKKEKKVDNEIMTHILNTILTRSSILALKLSEILNLPSPIPLPKVNKEE